jgi:prolyl 4-hydroxylase
MTNAPEPSVAGSPTYIHIDGQDIKVVAKMSLPRVVVFDNFLSLEECEGLINGVEHKIEQSTVVDETLNKAVAHSARTSSGSYYHRGQTELVARVEERIAKLLNWPVENGEGLQVLKYEVGQEYRPHNDYFSGASSSFMVSGGQRVGTFLMYLNTPARGGGTSFPDSGLEIAPQAGSALFFSYINADSSSKTLHAGTPVLEGEKWVATKWLRTGKF